MDPEHPLQCLLPPVKMYHSQLVSWPTLSTSYCTAQCFKNTDYFLLCVYLWN